MRPIKKGATNAGLVNTNVRLTAYQTYLLHVAIKEATGIKCQKFYRQYTRTNYRHKSFNIDTMDFDVEPLKVAYSYYERTHYLKRVLWELGFVTSIEFIRSPILGRHLSLNVRVWGVL